MAARRFNLKKVLTYVVNTYLLLMGMNSKHYDFANRSFYGSRWMKIYAYVMNIVLAISLPIVSGISMMNISVYADNLVARLTVMINSMIRFVVILLTIAGRHNREQHFESLTRSFFNLQTSYFDRLEVPQLNAYWERRFHMFYVSKFITMCVQPVTMVFGIWTLSEDHNLGILIISFYFANLNYILNAVIFQYFYALWHICKCFMILAQELQRLADRMEAQQTHAANMLTKESPMLQELSRLAAEDLRLIARVHKTLTDLAHKLNDCFKTQTLGVLMTYLFFNIMFGFYTWVVTKSWRNFEVDVWSSRFGMVLYFTLVADLFLFYKVCDTTATAQRSVSPILRSFTSLSLLSREFSRECASFAWQVSATQLQFDVAGLFRVNRQTALSVWAYTIRQTIVLIQFDYEDRLHEIYDD